MQTQSILALSLLLAACNSTREVEITENVTEPIPQFSIDDWKSEHIELPPAFAPTLPRGDELLLFAPGMFEAEAEDYWSYVFIMSIEQSELDSERLTSLFETYYDGLILAVAGDASLVGEDPATVEFRQTGDRRYEGIVNTTDAFVTMKPIELRVLIQTEDAGSNASFLRVQASPQPAKHEIWRTLEFAANSLTFSGSAQ